MNTTTHPFGGRSSRASRGSSPRDGYATATSHAPSVGYGSGGSGNTISATLRITGAMSPIAGTTRSSTDWSSGRAIGRIPRSTGISGTVIAESVNDDISISFDRLEGSGVMSMHSVNGDLNLGLPGNAGAELHIDSAEGEIISDFEVDVVPSKPVVTREDSRGGVEVKVESVIIAKLGGGGTIFKLKTLNGDINITKSD